MNKIKNYLIICILCFISFICGLTITSVKADTPKVNELNEVQGDWVDYKKIYVDGTTYIVFHNRTGSDIEVIKK